MKKQRLHFQKALALSLMLVLVAVCLSGCLFRDAVLDEQLALFVSCMNDKDPERLFQAMHPQVWREDFDVFYKWLAPQWHAVSTEDFTMTDLQVNTRQVNGERYGRSVGAWKVRFGQDTYRLVLVYDVDEKGSGIATMQFEPVPAASTSITVAAIALVVLTLAFIVYTAIDILRKKPRRYVLVLILAVGLVFVVRIGALKISIPLGSIGYWLLRHRLLAGRSIGKIDSAGEGVGR